MNKSNWIFIVLSMTFLMGQSVSGTITDENGNGLAGAKLLSKAQVWVRQRMHLDHIPLVAYLLEPIPYLLHLSDTVQQANLLQ